MVATIHASFRPKLLLSCMTLIREFWKMLKMRKKSDSGTERTFEEKAVAGFFYAVKSAPSYLLEISALFKKQLFFQRLAVTQLPIVPVIHVETLNQLQIHAGLQIRVKGHDKFIFLRVSDLQDAF